MRSIKFVMVIAALLASSAFGQVSVNRLPDLPRNFCGIGPSPDEGWIERYEIKFLTHDKWGAEHVSSGLVAFQKNLVSKADPFLYLHATTDKLEVPTKGSFESKFLACRVLTSRRVLIAPDYLGMGDDEQTHGYMIREEVNRVTMDMLHAVYTWFDRSQLTKVLTIAGYSQGGHSALSFHHFLDHEISDFKVAKTYAMSAPVNLSDDMLSTILFDRPSTNTTYLMALVLYNYQEYYGDVFSAPPMLERYSEAETLALAMEGGRLNRLLPRDPRQALRPEFVTELIADKNHPLRIRLKENDIPIWKASAPIVLTYSDGDDTIPGKQTKKFYQAMKGLSNRMSLVKTAIKLPHAVNFIRTVKWLGWQ